MVILNIILIDENIDNYEYKNFIKEFESINFIIVKCFILVKEAISYLKNVQFQETKIIINESLYDDFIQIFEENITSICVAPKIFIFTKYKDIFMEYHLKNNLFYNSGGIKTELEEIKKSILLENKKEDKGWINNIFFNNKGIISKLEDFKHFILNKINNVETKQQYNIQMTFEYIDSQEKLLLPLFYKTLVEKTSNKKMDDYTKFLCDKYSKENKLNELLSSIKSLEDIPIEILSKYYARAYTIASEFYRNINKDLGLNNKEIYLPFIKTLYEGIKLKSLPLASDNILYRGSKISKDEIKLIRNYLNKKLDDLPGVIIFSKSFLSFTKEKATAQSFMQSSNKNKNLCKVLYVLEKDDNIGYNLSTHCDIEKISVFPNEREVYFYRFHHLK